MVEKIIPIELNSGIVRKYYESSMIYEQHIKKVDFSYLLAAIVFFGSTVIVSNALFEKYVFLFFSLILASLYSTFQFLNYLFRRWKWSQLVRKISKGYKDKGKVFLKINENGIGIIEDSGEKFANWNQIESFKIDRNYLFLYFNDNTFSITPLEKVDSDVKTYVIKKLLSNGAINEI